MYSRNKNRLGTAMLSSSCVMLLSLCLKLKTNHLIWCGNLNVLK